MSVTLKLVDQKSGTQENPIRRNWSDSSVEVYLSSGPQEDEEIFRFRYEIYIEEMNRKVSAADVDHVRKRIRDELDDSGHNFLVRRNGELVAVGRINFHTECEFPYPELYQTERLQKTFQGPIGLITKLMVHPRYRRTRVFRDFVCALYRYVLDREASATILDCNDHLVEVFQSIGFVRYVKDWSHPDYGNVHAMVFDNYNLPHLLQTDSPLKEILEREFAERSAARKVS